MTSTELKHQARLKEWSMAIRECRSSGLSVRQWCREQGVTTTTYYRWERELLSKAAPALPAAAQDVFVEVPVQAEPCRNAAEGFATLRIGHDSIEFHQEFRPELLKAMIEGLRSC